MEVSSYLLLAFVWGEGRKREHNFTLYRNLFLYKKVTPQQVGQYFNKIQCFCFEEQKLQAGESVDMPVFFYIDPDFAKDPLMRDVSDVVLSYVFFKAK